MSSVRMYALGVFIGMLHCSNHTTPLRPSPQANEEESKSHMPTLVKAPLENVPHVYQKPDFCGEAIVEMVLKWRGFSVSQDDVFHLSEMAPERGIGATTRELNHALHKIGFETGKVWHSVPVSQLDEGLNTILSEIESDLGRGIPSIVCSRFDEQEQSSEHFRLVVGIDRVKNAFIYHDPAIKSGHYMSMPISKFKSIWPLKYASDVYTVIRFRLDDKNGLMKNVALPKFENGFSSADYSQAVMAAKEKGKEFSVTIEKPFIVAGNLSEEELKHFARSTVRWAVERLKSEYFSKNPKKILTIWLFSDAESYEKYCKKLFGIVPTTPYGFYDSEHEALIMNIGTGGGTLVHEIVHPFMEANVPYCPSWLNEGLGSLYEQSAERNNRIIGLTNWRLAGLQKFIRQNRVPPFLTLLNTSRSEFYNDDPGTNYAQSRYLLYYLQEKGLLRDFFHQFTSNRATDKTGYHTLNELVTKKLHFSSMAAFQSSWEKYVLALTFP